MNLPRLLIAAAALAAFAPALRAQTLITSIPTTISTSGQYQLAGNLVAANANSDLITISAPNVILDLKGFFVSGPGNTPATTKSAIHVLANVSNVTVRNGTLANMAIGMLFDADAVNSINHLVEDVNITRCYSRGLAFNGQSVGTVVRRCSLTQIGGSTSEFFNSTIGISGLTSSGLAGGITVRDCIIATLTRPSGGTIASAGITLQGTAPRSLAVANTLVSCEVGIASAKCRDNLTTDCATPFPASILDAGGND